MIEKEVSDALHVLLHCALKDKEYETQKEQFSFVYDYIFKLENNWNELKKFVEERIKSVQEEKEEFEEDLYNNYETNRTEIIIRRCELSQLGDVQERMQELEGNNE